MSRLIAVAALILSCVASAQQPPTPEQRIQALEAFLASVREQRQIQENRIEELGAILRIERDEAKKAASECKPAPKPETTQEKNP